MCTVRRFAFCFLILLLLAQACFAEKDVRPGSIVSFGRYEQDNDLTNGPESIAWQVLEVSGGKALLLSQYGLEAKPYNEERVKNVTWEQSTLRAWLNRDFLDSAFSGREQAAILMTSVDNGKAQGCEDWHVDGGNDTQDRVFLLSYAESWRYFADYREQIAQPTAYAVAQGVYTPSPEEMKAFSLPDWIGGTCGWWLRSPAYPGNAAVAADAGGRPFNLVDCGYEAVRPALWVEISMLP